MITCLHQNKNLTVVVRQDSADGIANELLTAGLIVGDDLVSMAANLDRLITQPPPSKQLCFKISSGIATHESPDEKALLGTDSFITASCFHKFKIQVLFMSYFFNRIKL